MNLMRVVLTGVVAVLAAADLVRGASVESCPGAEAGLVAADASLPPPPLERRVMIDGREVTVSLSLVRQYLGMIPEGGTGVAVRANVQVSVRDGALLPAGLGAAAVRFEKLRGRDRAFVAPMGQGTPFSSDFEKVGLAYSADITRPAGSVIRLKAVVRLVADGRSVRVNFGTVRIGLGGLAE